MLQLVHSPPAALLTGHLAAPPGPL